MRGRTLKRKSLVFEGKDFRSCGDNSGVFEVKQDPLCSEQDSRREAKRDKACKQMGSVNSGGCHVIGKLCARVKLAM
jgi:hypothetical protein